MSTVYVIYGDDDRAFVESTLLRPLPSRGFDSWVSSRHLSARLRPPLPIARAIGASDAILVVVSQSSAATAGVREEIAAALASARPVIPIRIDATAAGQLATRLESLPIVDLHEQAGAAAAADDRLRRALPDLLPPPDTAARGDLLAGLAERIDWNEEMCSASLGEALTRQNYHAAASVIDALARHVRNRPYPYPADHARADLAGLRRKRQFTLMRTYCEAVIASGTTDRRVRRQYGQSLIELGQFDQALEVLESVAHDQDGGAGEAVEARGLIGRLWKQQYVDAPEAPRAATRLRRAIAAYRSVYDEDDRHLWHGINASSCMLRGHRDGLSHASPVRARQIARRILERIATLEASGPLDVWDHATRIEALIALGRYDEATTALDVYLGHPDMDAFEVSSTHRQFDQVLQLGLNPRGRPILDRLWRAVVQHRAGGVVEAPDRSPAPAASATRPGGIPMLVRVSNPAWDPAHIPDLLVHARLGTIVSAEGTEATVKALLEDPTVISIDQSRQGGTVECERSVPFIRVAETYPGADAPFAEKGDAALVAVIDDGIDVLHQAFLDAGGRSRIVGIWDQGDETGPPPEGYAFGTLHSREDVARYVRDGVVPPRLGRNEYGHGTHVASIAAGRKAGEFAGGVAPEALLLIVISHSQDPIGYSDAHVAALAYIDGVATKLGMPVVVNVSQGMNAGAHDGKSLLEVAFGDFSSGGRKPGRVVVKSAGNERDKKGHAKIPLGQAAAEELRWVRPGEGTWPRERVELWWNSANEFAFQLFSPIAASEWVSGPDPMRSGQFPDGCPFRLEFTRRHVDNGDSHLRIDVGDGVATIMPGTWRLRIESRKVPEPGPIHAWIERGDASASAFANHADEEMTLSIPATAQNVIAVGAVASDLPIVVGDFSSYGPTRDGRFKPEVAAPGIAVRAAKGGTADEALERRGTSMAAPHVAGAIALVLSRAAKSGRPMPTHTQIASALRQKTRNYSANWYPGQGYGVVDAGALLAAF